MSKSENRERYLVLDLVRSQGPVERFKIVTPNMFSSVRNPHGMIDDLLETGLLAKTKVQNETKKQATVLTVTSNGFFWLDKVEKYGMYPECLGDKP